MSNVCVRASSLVWVFPFYFFVSPPTLRSQAPVLADPSGGVGALKHPRRPEGNGPGRGTRPNRHSLPALLGTPRALGHPPPLGHPRGYSFSPKGVFAPRRFAAPGAQTLPGPGGGVGNPPALPSRNRPHGEARCHPLLRKTWTPRTMFHNRSFGDPFRACSQIEVLVAPFLHVANRSL